MSAGVDSENERAAAVVPSEAVIAFIAARRTPRAGATRKLEEVVERPIAPPMSETSTSTSASTRSETHGSRRSTRTTAVRIPPRR
jgi:hypothetical protein